MLKRPSSRRKSSGEMVNLNLVPIIDAMVTLIGFLLFTTSFLSIVSIESPFPQVSKEYVQEKLKERPLQLTLTLRQDNAEIWSPFGRIGSKKIPHLPTGLPDVHAIHENLIAIKLQFPNESKIIMVPAAGTNYDVLISVMDAMRTIEAGDPPVFRQNIATGNDEAVKTLFPDVIFGNLLGDS